MGDAIDRAQDLSEALLADALRKQQLASAPARKPGLPFCENLDCREPIPVERQRLGGRLCDDCQRDEDIRSAQYAPGRGR